MKPTGDDFQPRRDGWYEHQGVWGEVVVGTVIASQKRTERWEIIEVAHGVQVEYGKTLWMRAREQTTGEVVTCPPRIKTARVRILTQSPADTQTGEPTPASDAEAVRLLAEGLGAQVVASYDHVTGETTCPTDFWERDGEREHLAFAHGIFAPPEATVADIVTLHGRAHRPREFPDLNRGGFPHRHVPEDLSRF